MKSFLGQVVPTTAGAAMGLAMRSATSSPAVAKVAFRDIAKLEKTQQACRCSVR